MSSINKNKYLSLTEKSFYKKLGKVTKIVGLTIESVGPDAKLNDLCRIYSTDNSQELYAEVVGFNDSNVLLMPYGVVDGIGPGSVVENMERPLSVKVGDGILGHTLDGLGNPTDGSELEYTDEYPVEAAPPQGDNKQGASSWRKGCRRITYCWQGTANRHICRKWRRKKYTSWYVCKKY